MGPTLKVRQCAHALMAALDISYQQALGSLWMLAEHHGFCVPTSTLNVAVRTAFGVADHEPVISLLEEHDCVLKGLPGWRVTIR